MSYRPRIQLKTLLDGDETVYIYKQVRIAASPSRRATTVTFLWKDVQTLLRGSGISPKEFNRLVVDAYERIEAKGFAPTSPSRSKSRQPFRHDFNVEIEPPA